MSANTRKYEEYLEYLPGKEQRAAEEAIYTDNNEEEMALAIIKRTNRENPNTQKPEKDRRNLLKRY